MSYSSVWSEIRNDFCDEDEKKVYIDAWLSDDGDEEGDGTGGTGENTSGGYLNDGIIENDLPPDDTPSDPIGFDGPS